MNKKINVGEDNLEQRIKNNGALYFFRSSPFTEYGEYNYNGALNKDFFFENLFTNEGKCEQYCSEIVDEIFAKNKKTIVLIGNQGCGKTTFVHYLKKEINDSAFFKILDFDKDTSNPKLEDYIEIFSSYLHSNILNDFHTNHSSVNKIFYNLYCCNVPLLKKINGANKVKNFFIDFAKTFIDTDNQIDPDDFINCIDNLFFNQILSLVVLWQIAEFKHKQKITPIIFCLDNLDVLVNNDIINGFFNEYFCFTRNIDSIIQHLDNPFAGNKKIEYNNAFTFVLCCRQHTWAKVYNSYIHQGNVVTLSTHELNITEAFNKNNILLKREAYINQNKQIYNEFSEQIKNVKSLLIDMKDIHDIYDLFNGDYRQCSVTFEIMLNRYPYLLDEYIELRKKLSSINNLYGARGLILKHLFDMFKQEEIFDLIGVLPVNLEKPPVSDARIILNYLDYHTYNPNQKKYVAFEKIVHDFEGIVEKERINYTILQMFKLGIENSIWNELVAFIQIDDDELDDCSKTKVFITKAGHEYLDLIATHFEFFNTRVLKKKKNDISLFSRISLEKYSGPYDYDYNFEETIVNVLGIVENCCKKMSDFYENTMFTIKNNKDDYLSSEFVYGNTGSKVFHGERIIHTHIRYIDNFRLFVLNNKECSEQYNKINKKLIGFIKNYIEIGNNNPNILSEKSNKDLFPKFNEIIKSIEDCDYTDYNTPIDVKTVKKI